MATPDYIQTDLFSLLGDEAEQPGEKLAAAETTRFPSQAAGIALEDLVPLAAAAVSDGEIGGAIAPLPPDPFPFTPADCQTALDILAVAETGEDIALLDGLTPAEKQQVWAVMPALLRQKVLRLQPAFAPEADQAAVVALQRGDRVVLKARPHLSPAELLAIFEVVGCQGDWIQVKAPRLGRRRYPAELGCLYPSGAPPAP